MRPYIPCDQLKDEVDVALWEIESGEDPGKVILQLLWRFRQISEGRPQSLLLCWLKEERKRAGGLVFRLRMLLGADRGGIKW
jgi:hypothetical protein